MTFCLGITVDQGLVGIADTRVIAGNECLTARKTATYQGPGFAFFVMHSGLRSARDKILLYFEDAFARETMTRERLFKVVNLYAKQVRRVCEEDGEALRNAELKFNAYSLIGGQMSGDSTHKLYLVYPEGNWVEIGPDTPYQIIGASGFGKPILERSLKPHDSMLYAFKVGILAFDATRLCAADVDFPMDVLLYSRNSFEIVEQRYHRDDLREITVWWQERMREAVHDLPSEWIEAAFPACVSR
ncbi:MAG: putative proteasome-type protease [Candidatus Solibacter sp.]|jgi:putative proteasome-type protease|nr:putative proteasome-type protease [Candidatus Solibacter sp.]